MRLTSVRARVVGLYLLLLSLFFAVFGLFLHLEIRRSLFEDLDHDLREEATEVAGGFVSQARSRLDWRAAFEEGLREAFPSRGIVDFSGPPGAGTVTYPPGFHEAIGAALPGFPDSLGFTPPRSVAIPGAPGAADGYRALGLVFRDAEGRRWICRIAYPLQLLHSRLARFARSYVLVSLVLFLLFFGGGWLLARRALEPVAAMTEAARRIDRRRLGERLPVPSPRDEIRLLAETFNGLLGRVEEAVRDVERVTADAAHELRTPIARVRAEVELAMGRARDPKADGETLESVLAGMVRLSRLVDDILLLARADAGALVPRRSRVPLLSVLEAVRETAEVLGAPRSIGAALAPVPESLSVEADPELLERALVNLVHNGIRYNRDEGLLEISAAARAGEVRIRIADTGQGIPAEQIPMLFRRFFRVDEARSAGGGSGLGLAIAAAIVAAHGGRIGVESELGRGTAFTVTLPLPSAPADGSPPGA